MFSNRVIATVALVTVLATACTSSGGRGVSNAEDPDEDVIRPARATWSSGYFQAAIYSELLRDLGYTILDDSTEEVSPDLFYPAAALGKFDYWANGWFPDALPVLETPLISGGTVGDFVTAVGFEVRSGGVQGFLIDKPTADAHSITSLGQIVEEEELRVLFDINEDGTADMFGCNKGWNCAETIERTIEINGWGNRLIQIQDDYDVLFLDIIDRVRSGRPTLYFAWTPNYTSAQLVPGRDVVWLGLGGDPAPGQGEPTDLPDNTCTTDPCRTGFTPSDIRVVANRDFLSRNPRAASLFDVVEIPIDDIAEQNLEMFNGANSQADIDDAAKRWIEANRSRVDAWLKHARQQAEP